MHNYCANRDGGTSLGEYFSDKSSIVENNERVDRYELFYVVNIL